MTIHSIYVHNIIQSFLTPLPARTIIATVDIKFLNINILHGHSVLQHFLNQHPSHFLPSTQFLANSPSPFLPKTILPSTRNITVRLRVLNGPYLCQSVHESPLIKTSSIPNLINPSGCGLMMTFLPFLY